MRVSSTNIGSPIPGVFISFLDEALESALGGFTAILTRHATEAAAGAPLCGTSTRATERNVVRTDVSSAAVDHL